MSLSKVALVFTTLISLSNYALAGRTVGYVAEDGAPLTTVMCAQEDDDIYQDVEANLMFCDDDGPWIEPVDCRGDVLFYVTTVLANATATSTMSCEGGCVKVTVIDMWPDRGQTSTLYDCETDLMGLEGGGGVETVFWSVPASLMAEESSTIESIMSEPTETDTDDPLDDPYDDPIDYPDPAGPNKGLIIGAAVGGVAGILLIATAIYLGIRFHKRKVAKKAAAVEVAERHVGGDPGPGAGHFRPPQPPSMISSGWGSTPSPPIDTTYQTWEASPISPMKCPYSPGAIEGWSPDEPPHAPYEMEGSRKG